MDRIEKRDEFRIELERISLDERMRIVGLRSYVHADNFEPGSGVPDARPASATKKVKQARLARYQF